MRCVARAATAALVLAGLWLGVTAHATAAPGQIAYDRCFANDDGPAGCAGLPGAPLTGARGVAVSPDGGSVYVASAGSASVARFLAAGSDGGLTYAGCLANDGPAMTCGDLPVDVLGGAWSVAVSPDGRSAYVASSFSESIAHFFRGGSDGQIALDGCLASTLTQGCGDLPGSPIEQAQGVAVSPDGKSVYVASYGSDSIAHFFRSGPEGQIAYDGCLADTAMGGCGDLQGAPLNGARGVATSPDGKSVYVVSALGKSISHFLRSGPDGQIVFDGCLDNDGAPPCVELYGSPLSGAQGVAVSPDGRSVYVASADSATITHFVRSQVDGRLTYAGCLSGGPPDGCAAHLPGNPLVGATAVAVSPDGRSVYVTSSGSNSILHFFTDSGDGHLTYGGCLADDNGLDQRCVDLPGRPLAGAESVAVSPDGRSVYVTSPANNTLAHFFRAVGDEPLPGSGTSSQGTGPGTTGTTGAPGKVTCRGVRATIVGTGGRDRLRGTRRRDVIAALGGDDVVRGLAGNDLVCAGAGDDLVAGGPGRDMLRGEAGRDRLVGGPGRDRLIGGPGRDRLIAGPGRERVKR